MKSAKKLFFFFTIFLIAIAFVSCDMYKDMNRTQNGGSINGNQGGTPGINTGNQTSSYTASTTTRDITADSYDTIPAEFDETVTVILSDVSTTCSGSNCKVTTTNDLVTVEYSGSGSVLFNISGTLSSHGLLIDYEKKGKAVGLNLSDVSITSTDTPCIYAEVKKTQSLYIILSGTNTLTEGRSYGTGYGSDFSADGDDSKGTVYSKGPVILSGDGSLTITEGYKHGIASKDYIKVNSGTINITSTGRNGFQAVNGFIMNYGSVTVKGNGTHTNNQSRGIVVEGSDEYDDDDQKSYSYPGEGFIVINGGTLNITTVSKGITAKWDIDEDADTTDTTDDPYPYVKITGGDITIRTTGTPTEGRTGTFTDADGVSVTEEIKLAPEGIEGKQAVFISGGTLNLNCTDDCINSSRDGSSKIEISGGSIYACSTSNDAVDSNGSLTISGGNVVAIATHTPECAFDCDQYTFSITGGTVAGIGTSNYSEPTSSACSQGVLVLSSSYLGSAGKTTAIKNSGGDVVYAFTIPSGTSINGCVGIFSSPSLTNTGSYTLVKSADASSGSSSNGLYTSMPELSGGTSYSGISFSGNYVYTAGNTGNQGAQEGPRK